MTARRRKHDALAARDSRAVVSWNDGAGRVRRGPSRGFSLLELVTVLAIIATLGSIAAPRYAGALANYRADAAARRVAADLRQASRRARITSTPVTVDFDEGNDRYELLGVPHPDDQGAGYVVTLSDDPYLAALVSAPDEIVFNIYGEPDQGGTIVVRVGQDFDRSVVVNAATGEVTLP